VIVNTDSMQVYSVLRLLTARPDGDDLAAVTHHLYGHVHPSQAYSVGHWQRDVGDLIASGKLEGKRAIFTGGTGLYFKALTGGLSEMPQVDPVVREKWRARFDEDGGPALHAILVQHDPEMAMQLKPGDGQRIVRALEVLESTGRSITHWREMKGASLVDDASLQRVVIDPGREVSNARIERRFNQMIDGGALDEVQTLLNLDLDPSLPAMKSIGVPELEAFLQGAISRDQAVERAVIATRQYAKRQRTWFRNQFGAQWQRIAEAADLLENYS